MFNSELLCSCVNNYLDTNDNKKNQQVHQLN